MTEASPSKRSTLVARAEFELATWTRTLSTTFRYRAVQTLPSDAGAFEFGVPAFLAMNAFITSVRD